jgi:NAD(P)H-hydrate epimerase
MKVLNPDEMRRMDETCIHKYKVPAQILMENAALSALSVIQEEYPHHSVLLLCGSGNNGGDGLALARILFSLEKDVEVLLLGNPDHFSKEASQNYRAVREIGIPLSLNPKDEKLNFKPDRLIVDALLGIGLNRTVSEKYKTIIERMNHSGAPIFSLDIPSGIDGTTAQPRGISVRADKTICFGAPKRGNILSPGYVYNGELYCSRISFPPPLIRDWPGKTEFNIPSPLVQRDPLGYKNSFGRILIIGGGKNYQGAPALAAQAAYRSGAGYVTAAIPQSQASGFSAHCPEAVVQELQETTEKTISEKNETLLLDLASKHDVVLMGPGMTGQEETVSLIRKLIPLIPVPLVLDADGLNALAGSPDLTSKRKFQTVITPHLGEQKRLRLGLTEDQSLEERYGVICVYKGPRSRICQSDGKEYINLTGNDALGTAGSGDVLAGMVATLIATQESVIQGVCKAVLLHGLTAERYSGARESFTASDIIEALPRCLLEYKNNYNELKQTFLGKMKMIP